MRQWETTTASQQGARSSLKELTDPDTPVIGTGEHQAVVLPVNSQTHAARLLDPRTGQLTDVGSKSPFREQAEQCCVVCYYQRWAPGFQQ